MNSNGHQLPTGELVAELHHRFASSEYGAVLRDRVRYEDYRPEHISNEEWEAMFGADVNNLEHLPLTHSLGRGFLRGCRTPHQAWEGGVPLPARFSTAESRTLEVAFIVHDWGEAGEIGDRMYHLKTANDEAQEALDLQGIIAELVPEHRHLPEFRELPAILADTVGETKLGQAFNTVERMGYMRTGLRFWKRRQISDDGTLNKQLDFISHFMFHEHLSVLLERAKTYPATDGWLRDNLGTLVALAEDFETRRPTGTLGTQYDRHLRTGDSRQVTFDLDFSETARALRERYAVDAAPATA